MVMYRTILVIGMFAAVAYRLCRSRQPSPTAPAQRTELWSSDGMRLIAACADGTVLDARGAELGIIRLPQAERNQRILGRVSEDRIQHLRRNALAAYIRGHCIVSSDERLILFRFRGDSRVAGAMALILLATFEEALALCVPND